MRTLFFICLFFSTMVQAGSDCQQYLDDCEYYSCIEVQKQCGEDGYPIGFGRKYCMRFEERRANLSPEGQEWMKRVRSCLIAGMEESSDELTCREFKSSAVKLHVPCYVDSGYCQLSKKDKKAVIKMIRWSMWRPSLLSAGIQVLRSCK
ncbi:MAG: hypothetical protein EP326_06595 [Deltaproteobacteria bacterium]|nr:MAG: hypothetical protein EP326_06595 [Deltaproteobacteria bacterium]TNF28766.1 MAG: hypothetical protein EP319_08425 [Deltaproteobacteria bacterium]